MKRSELNKLILEELNESHISSLYLEYCSYVHGNNMLLTEKINFSIIPDKLKNIFNLIDELKDKLKLNIASLIKLFLNSKFFAFFKHFGFDLEKIFGFLKKGFQAYKTFSKTIQDYIKQHAINKWTEDKLKKLNDFLKSHPALKHFGGVVIGSMLLYIWVNSTFTGNMNYDFDFSAIFDAVLGKFDLVSMFSGPDGLQLLLFFISYMVFGLTFPWPGPLAAKFAFAVIKTVAKALKQKIQK